MKRYGNSLIIIISLLLIIILSAFYYVFNIYETEIETGKNELFAGSRSVVSIHVYPINALGFRVPFRKITASFKIEKGKNLVEIFKEDDDGGLIVLRAKNTTGKVVVYVKTKYSLLPSIIEINIYPNAA